VSVRPYGTWPSPVASDAIAREPASRFALVDVRDGRVRWSESRAAEGGRTVVVEWEDGRVADVTPAGTNARTRVHEYGGGAVWSHGETIFFSEFADGRVYRLDPGGDPRPVTPEPSRPHALRYADGTVTPDGETVVSVRERHEDGEVVNDLVAYPADASADPVVVASGHDFFAAPRVSPDGRRLAWLAWDHPRLPWDGTELYVAELRPDGTLGEERLVAGGADESILQPRWSPAGALHFCSDRNGWWNLHRFEDGGSVRPLTTLEDGEIGYPDWVFGMQSYAFLDEGRVACVVTRRASDSLELLDPATGALTSCGVAWTACTPTCLGAGGGRVVFAAASPTRPTTLVAYDPASGEEAELRHTLELELDPAGISVPRAIEFPTLDGEGVAHAFFYPPAHAGFEGPEDERPPLRVICHGGPTGHSAPGFEADTQYFTSRGIGVVDVNYRGSSGFGRGFRRLLDGRWGEIDWRDCVAAARHLAETGEADPDRTWVEGGSAGGYVVLCSLTFEPRAFAAGVSLFGVADAEALVRDTHKFESRYFDTLIGPYPERADLYRERSPVHFVDRLERPLLLLQGLDDEIVPPNQAEMMAEVLDGKGVPHAYLAFEGEGHGFRKEENIRRTLEATLGFVGRIFGFEPADDLEPLEIAHLG
jgi:dipeptidyl aminopeptidase/acylaminoacyl peptidase